MAGGRPPLYKTEKDLDKAINAYFDSREIEFLKDDDGNIKIDKSGMPIIINLNAPSVSGLALYLGYASRQSIYDNEKHEKFSYIIKKAKTRVEEWVYQSAMAGYINHVLAIFILKQFGYTDKQELEHNVKSIPDLILKPSE